MFNAHLIPLASEILRALCSIRVGKWRSETMLQWVRVEYGATEPAEDWYFIGFRKPKATWEPGIPSFEQSVRSSRSSMRPV